MDTFLDVINSADVFSLLLLIAVLCWLGNWMIGQHAQLRQWGQRLAAGAFIIYCVMIGSDLESHTPGTWLGIAWRGILAAGLTLGASWVVLAVYGFLKSGSDRAAEAAKARAYARQQQKELQRREQEEQRRREEWERQAPERERQKRLAEEQKRQEQESSAEAQRFRDDIRYACELVYNMQAPKIADRFSKEDFHDFLNRYMNDKQPTDVIRRRADQLTQTIQEHVEAIDPPDQFSSLDALTGWYSEQKAQIENLDIDGGYKRTYLVQLHRRFYELSQRVLEALRP